MMDNFQFVVAKRLPATIERNLAALQIKPMFFTLS